MKPLKIAQVTNLAESVPPKNKAGLEQMVYYLTEELVKLGHDVTLFGTADSKTNANLVPIWPQGLSNDEENYLRTIQTYSLWAVSEVFLQAEQFDIIHDHTYFTGGTLHQLIKTPVVSSMHHPVEYELSKRDYKLSEKHKPYLDHIYHSRFKEYNIATVSQFQKDELGKQLNRKSHVHVVHNGISVEEWPEYGKEPGDYFSFLGYISGNKGVGQAIQAVLPTNEKLKIAGPIDLHDTPSREYFEKEIEPFIDGDQIQYIGPLGMEEKKTFLQKSKGTLMPIQWDEPFGLVAIESMVSGAPVIAWSRGALPEIIVDGKTGFLINSVEEMTEKLGHIDTIDRSFCREHVISNFSAKKMAESYVEVYEKIISQS